MNQFSKRSETLEFDWQVSTVMTNKAFLFEHNNQVIETVSEAVDFVGILWSKRRLLIKFSFSLSKISKKCFTLVASLSRFDVFETSFQRFFNLFIAFSASFWKQIERFYN